MNILLVAATSAELQDSIAYYKGCCMKEKSIHLLITGIGLVHTTYYLTQYMQHARPDIAIQAGIAGLLSNRYALTDTVCIYQDFFADMGVVEGSVFKDVFDLNLDIAYAYPFNNKALVNPNEGMLSRLNLPQVTGISVNEVTTQAQRIQYYEQKYNADVESMEGAAFHYVCLQQRIPFIQIRSISNIVGVRDKNKWKVKEAVKALNQKLIETIELLMV